MMDDVRAALHSAKIRGDIMPKHIRDAKENGWIHKKLGDRWKDFCPDCHEYELQKRRETYFKREDDK